MSGLVQLPRVLKNMNLFVDGRGYAGRIEELELPKLTLKTEEHRAGGMDLPVEVELGMEKLEVTMTIADFDPDVFRLFGLLDSEDVPLTLRGAVQRQGEPVDPVVVQMRGGWKEIDSGTWKPGEKSALKIAAALSYLKITMNGDELVEIDAKNMIRTIGGTDQLAGIRDALGL